MRATSSRVGPFLETTKSSPGIIFSSTSYFSLIQGPDKLLRLDHNKILLNTNPEKYLQRVFIQTASEKVRKVKALPLEK